MTELGQQFTVFVGLNLLVLTTANTIIWRYYADEMKDVFDWAILMFVLMAGEILLILSLTGFFFHFSPRTLGLGTLLCFLFATVRLPFSTNKALRLGPLSAWNRFRELIKRQDVLKAQEWIFAVFGFLILLGAIELFNAFVQFPWEYDSIAYHLSIMVEWLQAGNLWDVLYAAWGGPLGYYPSTHELMSMWLIIPFGNDYLVNLSNFGIVGVMIIVVYKLLVEMGVQDFLAWLAGALVMVMPIFLRQVGTSQVDILLALTVIIAWYLLLRSFLRKDGLLLIPLLITMAILLGTKYLAIMYIIPILLVFFGMFSNWRKNHRYWLFWTVLILASIGSIWYWRNLVLTGNPVFPADIQLGGQTLFEGYSGLTQRIQKLSLWHRITESGQWIDWFRAMQSEVGWHLYLVVGAYVLLVFEMITKLLFSRFKRGEGRIYVLMLFFLPAYWYLYFIAPYTASMMEHNVRYAMPWLLLSMLMVIYTVHKLGPFRKIMVMVLTAFVWWQFLMLVVGGRIGQQNFLELSFISAYPILFAGLLLSLALGVFFFESWRKQQRWSYLILIAFFVCSFSFLDHAIDARSALRHASWQHKYSFPIMQAYEWLDENVAADAVIANSLNPLYYPLYGQELQRRVRYININSCGECDYYGYQKQQLTLRENPSYEAWLQNLRDFQTDYVLLGYSIELGLEDVEAYEFSWAAEHPEDFEVMYAKDGVFVYHLLDEDTAFDTP